MFSSSHDHLEGWVQFVFMFCCISHLLCIVRIGLPALFERLTIIPLRSPWAITRHCDLKPTGSEGWGVSSIPYVPGLARPVPEVGELGWQSPDSAPGLALPLGRQLPFPTRLGTSAIVICHLILQTPPAVGPRAVNFFVSQVLHCKTGIVIRAHLPPQDFCKE